MVPSFWIPINLYELVEIVGQHFKLKTIDAQTTEKSIEPVEEISKDVLNKVIALLEGDQYRSWESSLMTSSFTEIELFAQNIKKIGSEFSLKALQSFSDVLVMHAKNFDIDNMNDVLKSYPKIIQELKNRI